MDFKTFFIKKIMMSFCISLTCIIGAMALIGLVFEPSIRFGYEAFLSPDIFGILGTLPTLVKYTKKELSIEQTLLRNVLHLILLEAVILTSLYLAGLLTSISMAVSLAISIVVIDFTVNLVLWIHDAKTAKEFNDALQKMQSDYTCSE